jgi:hypothetical protein
VCVCVCVCGAYSSCIGTPNARRNLWPRRCICPCLHGWRGTRVSAEILRLHDSTKTMGRPRHSLAGFWNSELTMPSQQDHDMLTEHTRCQCSSSPHTIVLPQLWSNQMRPSSHRSRSWSHPCTCSCVQSCLESLPIIFLNGDAVAKSEGKFCIRQGSLWG